MSFEVFIQCFTCGERDGVPESDIQRAFGTHLSERDDQWWHVYYDEMNSSDILVKRLPANKKLIHSLSVHRPAGDPRLWDALLSILKLGHLVLYFPAEKPPLLVADDSVSEHLPKEMVESMGKVTHVRSARDILDEIQKA